MSNFQLKILALLLMVIDHIGYFSCNENFIFFRFIGRLSMPIFGFTLVQGYIHTKNIKKYLFRLYSFSIIMMISNSLLSVLAPNNSILKLSPIFPNIFLSMALSLSILLVLDKIFINIKNMKFNVIFMYIILLIILLFIGFFIEYQFIIIGITIGFYATRKSKIEMIFMYISLSIILSLLFSNLIQLFMIFSIIPICFYNNNKGYSSKLMKYFFYLFYPIHIYLLYLIY